MLWEWRCFWGVMSVGRPLVPITPQPFLHPDSGRPSFPPFASHAQPGGCRMVFPTGSGLKSVCVFVCVREREHVVCVCVCVCVRARARARECAHPSVLGSNNS